MRRFWHILCHCDDPIEPAWIVDLHSKLDAILKTQGVIVATLDEVLAEVTDESTRLDSIQALIDGVKQQLADALAGTTIPPATQAKIDAVFSGLTGNKAKIDKALNVGVPAP